MSERSTGDPTKRFTGLASVYARFRPSYPREAVDFILTHCRLAPGAVLVDVGSGTGISSRVFAARGLDVIGIEPNAEMRARAEAEPPPPGPGVLEYREGRAEASGLAEGIAHAVLSAQAFHWFEPAATLREFHRILRPNGWAILIWNERDLSDAFTAAYGAVIRAIPGAAAVEGPRGRAGEALLANSLFGKAQRFSFANEQLLDEDGLLGRAFSASYVPHEGPLAHALARSVGQVFHQFESAGHVVLRYETSVYLGQRVD